MSRPSLCETSEKATENTEGKKTREKLPFVLGNSRLNYNTKKTPGAPGVLEIMAKSFVFRPSAPALTSAAPDVLRGCPD
jgi:hypothetical protein